MYNAQYLGFCGICNLKYCPLFPNRHVDPFPPWLHGFIARFIATMGYPTSDKSSLLTPFSKRLIAATALRQNLSPVVQNKKLLETFGLNV